MKRSCNHDGGVGSCPVCAKEQAFDYKVSCWKGQFRNCCCDCKFQHPLYSHPWVDGKAMSNQDGWICLMPEFAGVAIKSNGHGLCEVFESKSGEKVYPLHPSRRYSDPEDFRCSCGNKELHLQHCEGYDPE